MILSAVATLASASNQERWIGVQDISNRDPVAISVSNTSHRGFDLDLSVSGFWTEDRGEDSEIYQRIRIPSGGRTEDIGRPEIPYIGRYFAVPQGAEISVQVSVQDSAVFNDILLWPAQEATPDEENAVRPAFRIDDAWYSSPDRCAEPLYRVSESIRVRGADTRLLGLFPIRFDPVDRQLTLYTKIAVRITFSGGTDSFVEPRLQSRFFQPLFRNLLLNYDSVDYDPQLNMTRDGEGEMLIITTPILYDATVPLAEWRTQTGLTTVVKTLSEVGNTAGQIRDYIQDAYDTWETPPSFLLIIGDADKVPTNYVTYHPWNMNHVGTDVYYTTVDGSDLFSDIHHGRISVENANQLTAILSKYQEYELDPESGSWNNHVFLASYQEPGYYFHITSDRIYDFLTAEGYDCDRAYENGTPHGTTQDIIDNFNNGSFIVNHRDHGGRENWVHPSFWISDFWQLDNGAKLPLVFSVNCLSGYFDAETDDTPGGFESFTEELLRLSSRGAVGVIASTRTSYSGYNDELNIGFFDALFPSFDPLYPGGSSNNPWPTPEYHPGAIVNFGKWYMYDKFVLTGGSGYPEWPPASWKTTLQFEMYHYHGDPSQDIHTSEPIALAVTHDPTIPIGATSFFVSVSNAEGGMVAISEDGVLLGRASVDGGSATVPFEEPVQGPSVLDVVVTAHNRIPYHETVNVTALDGWYVILETVSYNDRAGFVNGISEQGDSIAVTLTLANIGAQDAPSVGGTLSSADQSVEITDGSAYFGTIGSENSVTREDACAFTIDGGIEDGHSVSFDLTITAGDSTWDRPFSLTVHAPDIVLGGYTIDDSGGNNNGRLDPGETADIWITIENNGSGWAAELACDPTTLHPHITILSSTLSFGEVEPGTSGTCQSPLILEVDADCPEQSLIDITGDVSAFGPYTTTLEFMIPVSQKTVLVVDTDSESTEQRLIDAMAQSGYTYDTWFVPDQGSVPEDTLILYSVVVWTGGDNNAYSMSSTDRQNMASYLSQGGALFFSSENYLTSYGEDPFTSSYLHIADYTTNVNVHRVRGIENDPISDDIDLETSFPNGMSEYPDIIVPDAESMGILRVGYTTNITALRYPISGSSTYRLVFMATPFEALTPGQPDPNNPETFLQRSLDWLMGAEDDTPPQAISDLILSVYNGTDVLLSWSVPWDDTGIDHYDIYRSLDSYFVPSSENLIQTEDTAGWTDYGAAGDPDFNPYYRIIAVDAAENESAPSNRVGVFNGDMNIP